MLSGIVKQCLTLSDNQTYSLGAVGSMAALLSHIGFTGYDVIGLHHAFQPHIFGAGVAAIIGAGAFHQKYTDPGLANPPGSGGGS